MFVFENNVTTNSDVTKVGGFFNATASSSSTYIGSLIKNITVNGFIMHGPEYQDIICLD